MTKLQGHFLCGVGTGKTFAAACIAHALTEQGILVLMTNFSKILNSLSGMFSEDKNRYLFGGKNYRKENAESTKQAIREIILQSEDSLCVQRKSQIQPIPPHRQIDHPALIKKIEKTTYRVHIHFSTISTETMSDKIKRILKMRYSRCKSKKSVRAVHLTITYRSRIVI